MTKEKIKNREDLCEADYFRRLVYWLDTRPENLNRNKSRLTLMKEFNNQKP